MLGPLFILNITSLIKIIRFHPDVKFHFHAGGTQLYAHLSHSNGFTALTKLNACLLDIQRWLVLALDGKLQLNPDKTENMFFLFLG